jgi:Putative Ig domain/Abnormal spindle-like microcephaly-assoc'd, ASPM-SPD-2-Hydin
MECIGRRNTGNMATLAVLMAAMSLGAAAQPQAPSPSQTETSQSPPPAALTSDHAELVFGPQNIGTTSDAQVVTLENKGKTAVDSLSVTISGDYSQSNTCNQTLGPQEHCQINVRFSPTETGERRGTLTVQYRSPGASQSVSLPVSLKGEGPPLKVAPFALDFGQQVVASTSVVRTVTLTSGPKVMNITALSAGDFTVTPASCHLEPTASCALTVTFAPKQFGPTTSAITITSDVVSFSPQIVSLRGEGVWRCPAPPFLSCEGFKSFALVLFVVLAYLSGIIVVRWNMVARPTRKLLQAQIDGVRAEVSSLTLDVKDVKRQQVLDLLTLAESPFLKGSPSKGLQAQEPGVPKRQKVHFADYFFWTRGEEIAAWGYVHQAEELLADLLSPETVRARLENAEQELRRLNTPPATALAERINQSLAAATVNLDRLRGAVQESLQFLAPKANDLLARIDQALADPALADPAAQLPPDWKDVLQKIQDTLLPRADALAATVDAALLAVLPADTEIFKQLEKDADDRIKSPAAQLKASLQPILTGPAGQPPQAPQPPSIAAWLSLLRVARDLYATYTDQLAARVRVAVAQPSAPPLDRWRALLREALGIIYDNADRDYSDFMSWQNKAVWLTGCGLLFIVTLAATLQHGGLLLVGAVGGLLSRLSRSLQRANVPTDYGASWTTLFLSPVVGALAGWSGVLLVILAVQLNVLGPLFKTDWCNPWSPLTLGIAFLLGFSERAFDSILSQLEDKTQAQAQTKAAQTQELSITTGGALTPGKVNSPYSQVLAASGGTAPYKWTLTAGKLPDDLNLDPAGKITGTPTAAGNFKFTLQVSDAAAKTKPQEFTIVVA